MLEYTLLNDLCTNHTKSGIFLTMSKIAKITCRVIPVHAADVKRTFSQLKLET